MRERSIFRSWLRRARISAARVRTFSVRWPRALARAGTTTSLPIPSMAASTARRTVVGPWWSLRSRASITRGVSNRCSPATAAMTTLGFALSRKRATVVKYCASVQWAVKAPMASTTTGSLASTRAPAMASVAPATSAAM